MELLQYLSYALVGLPFVMAFVLAIALCAFTVSAFRSPTGGLWLLGFVILWDTLVGDFPLLRIALFIYMPDLVCSLLAAVAVLRVLAARQRAPIHAAWLVFVAVLALSFGLGLASFGTAAGTALRPYFYAAAVTSYFMTFPFDEALARRAITALGWTALGLVLVVLFRWLVVTLPIDALLPPGGSFDPMRSASILRVVGAEEAAVIGLVFVAGLFYPQTSGLLGRFKPLVVLFALAVIGLQHRSVWVAALAAIAARYALPAAGRKGSTQLAVLVLALALMATPLVLSGGGVGRDLARSADRAVALTDSAQVRLDSWRFAVGKWADGGTKAWLIGLPLGTSMERYQVSTGNTLQRINFQAHNFYVQSLFNLGLIGLGAILILFGWAFTRLYRLVRDPAHGPTASALIVMLALQVSFYITYGITYTQGLVLGVAVSFALTAMRAGATRKQPILPNVLPVVSRPGTGLTFKNR